MEDERREEFQRELERCNDTSTPIEEKRALLNRLVCEYEDVLNDLAEKTAASLKELYK